MNAIALFVGKLASMPGEYDKGASTFNAIAPFLKSSGIKFVFQSLT